ncbi:MAG: hypothetical protein WC444_06470 [Candidatus Paceibacterota bacterium]
MAFTETAIFAVPVANQMFICYKLTGDASDTAWTAPLGTIDACWVQETTAFEGRLGVSFATNVVTFSSAPAATSYYYVFVIGTA